MPRASLTQTFCDRCAKLASGKYVDYFDERTTGLALRVSGPSKHHKHGLRVWRWSYRFNHKQLVITIGHAPPWSAEAAHAFAHKAQVVLDEGKDPAGVLRPRSVEAVEAIPAPIDTVKAMVARYETELDRKSDAHRRNTLSYFTRYVIPAWGDRDVSTISRRDIVDLINKIDASGTPVAANRCATALTAWFNYLVKQGILATSPALSLPKTEEKERSRVLSVAELALIWRAAAVQNNPAGRFVQLMIATLTRRDEAAKLLRGEIKEQDWLLPKERNKSGRDFVIPLSTLAQNVLDQCPDTGPFVFSVTGRNAIGGFSAIKAKLDAAIVAVQGPGQPPLPHWTFHDIRRSVNTALAELKVDHFVCERLLNHILPKLDRTYNHYKYRAEKAKALRLWSDYFGPLVDPHYNVVAIDAAA